MTKLDDMLDQLSEIVAPIVQHIEQSTPTTKNHYGDYITAITRVADMLPANQTPSLFLAIGVALQRAGANKAGVLSALRVMGKL